MVFEHYRTKFRETYNPLPKCPQLRKEDFDLIQANLGIQLPDEFKTFYSLSNGAMPDEQYYKLKSKFHHEPEYTPDYIRINYFIPMSPEMLPWGERGGYICHGFYPGDPEERSIDLDDPLHEGWDPKKCQEYLTFGEASNHSAYLLIGIVESNFGQVFLWHEDEDEIGNPIFLSDTFSHFLENMGTIHDVAT